MPSHMVINLLEEQSSRGFSGGWTSADSFNVILIGWRMPHQILTVEPLLGYSISWKQPCGRSEWPWNLSSLHVVSASTAHKRYDGFSLSDTSFLIWRLTSGTRRWRPSTGSARYMTPSIVAKNGPYWVTNMKKLFQVAVRQEFSTALQRPGCKTTAALANLMPSSCSCLRKTTPTTLLLPAAKLFPRWKPIFIFVLPICGHLFLLDNLSLQSSGTINWLDYSPNPKHAWMSQEVRIKG